MSLDFNLLISKCDSFGGLISRGISQIKTKIYIVNYSIFVCVE